MEEKNKGRKKVVTFLWVVTAILVFATVLSLISFPAAAEKLAGVTNLDQLFLLAHTTTPVLKVNQTSTGAIAQFQDNGTTVFGIADGGSAEIEGAFTIDGSANTTQLVVEGHSTQTADLVRFRTSAAANLFTVTNAGNTMITGTGTIQGLATVNDALLVDGDGDEVQLTIQGHSTQNAALARFQTNAAANVFEVTNAGNTTITGTGTIQGLLTVNDATLIDGDSDEVQLRVQGHSSQNAPLAWFQTSAGVNVFAIDNSGNTTITGTTTFVGNISDNNSAVTVADNMLVDGAADAAQLTVQGYATQTNNLLTLEQSDGTDVITATNAGALSISSTLNVGGDIGLQNDETIGNAVNGQVTIGTDELLVGTDNTLTGGTTGSTIAGGGLNVMHSEWSFIGGGASNVITAATLNDDSRYSVIAGGNENEIESTGDELAIVGGYSNAITGTTSYGFIGGGYNNAVISSTSSVVAGGAENEALTNTHISIGGGYDNDASGDYATIPGGRENGATGDYSFAAGRRAQATQEGSFVWADSTDADATSPMSNTMYVRATNGVTITNDLDVGDDVKVGNWQIYAKQPTFTVVSSLPITSTGTYMPLTAGGTVTPSLIVSGTTTGQILILENTVAQNIILLDNAAQNMNLTGTITMTQYDLITLIWNGADWMEMAVSAN